MIGTSTEPWDAVRWRDVSGYRDRVREVVAAVDPWDDVEARDLSDTLRWIAGGAPLCRTVKPATPPEHLVAYAVAIDVARAQVLLVDHRLAGRWLPTGGHVEPGEHPGAAARRELQEELGIEARHLAGVDAPLMVSRTVTVGRTAGHTDVSLWYAFAVGAHAELEVDPTEFVAARWWLWTGVAHGPGTRFDPHLPRFIAKAAAQGREA